jgi:hypothetical protein
MKMNINEKYWSIVEADATKKLFTVIKKMTQVTV